MKKFAVVLSGCGVYDGAEIQEAILTLLAIEKNGATYQVFAPDIIQHDVINHLSGEKMTEQRNVLIESARIARGNAKPLTTFSARDFDALIFPGGFGCAKNLSSWAYEGDTCNVNPDVEKAITEMNAAGKPVGAMCIAPVILGKLFKGIRLTTGNDKASGDFIKKMGSTYVSASHGEVVVDRDKKIFTTPCYMLDAGIVQIAEGTENIVKAMLAEV
jgi:enhancing lycopene biosynthesis protein 2